MITSPPLIDSQDPQEPLLQQKSKKKIDKSAPRISVNDRTSFLFPTSKELFQNITNKYHLRDVLISQAKKQQVDIQMHTYCFERNNRSYLYTKCIQCGSKLKLKFIKTDVTMNVNQGYKLIFFDNTHSHVNFVRKKKHQYNMDEVFEIMRNTSKDTSIDQFKLYLKQRYHINDSHIYYMLSRFRKFHESLFTITEYLKKHHALIWTDIFKIDEPLNCEETVEISAEEDPSFFMFSLPKMQQNFQRYGDCCYFNITKGLIKKRNVFDNREWNIVAFNGLSYQNRFAPFALAFLEVTPKFFQNVIELIKRVFNWGKKMPKTFITPYQPIYTKVVNTLRKKGIFNNLHIYDALEELQHIEKVISDKNQFKFFQDIVQSTCRSEYQANMQKFFKNVVPTLQVRKMFNNLNLKASKMCFALIDTDNFIGMGFKYSANRYMSILVRYLYTHNSQAAKITLPRPKELYPSIKFLAKEYLKLLQPELSYIKYDCWKLQHIMNIPQMLLIRNRIKQAVMDIFLAEFYNAFDVDARLRSYRNPNCPQMVIYDIFDKNSRALYVVAPRPEYDNQTVFKKIIWRCSCLYSVKCGMPCSHQIKVVMLNQGSLLDQVHQRWIEAKVGRKKAPGRPKVSRRNTMK